MRGGEQGVGLLPRVRVTEHFRHGDFSLLNNTEPETEGERSGAEYKTELSNTTARNLTPVQD